MIDEQVALVLDYLDGIGELDNTLVVYTGDHGHMNGHHGLYFKGNATQPPNFYDESIQVPCVLRWPGQIAAGTVSAAPASHCDLFQTVLGAAGVSVSGYDGPGRSYLGLLGNAVDMKWGDASFCEYGTARMIRTPKWKLVVRYAPQATGDELYDLERDPRETKNVLSDPKNAAIVAELRERLDAFFAKYTQPGRDGREIAARRPTTSTTASFGTASARRFRRALRAGVRAHRRRLGRFRRSARLPRLPLRQAREEAGLLR